MNTINRTNVYSVKVGCLLLFILLSGCVSIKQKPSPSSVAATPEPTTEQRMSFAREAYQAGKVDQALMHYRKVVEKDNLHRKANYNLTIVHIEMALKGMEFLGQFVSDRSDASEARSAFDTIVREAEKFTEIVSRHIVE